MEEPLITGDLEHDRKIINARLDAVSDFGGDNFIPELDWAVISYLHACLILRGFSFEDVKAFAISVYWLGRYAESQRQR